LLFVFFVPTSGVARLRISLASIAERMIVLS
jgi:hypothetical protein